MNSHFFSPGKLLLTAEYFVLDGALALAVPTKVGQEMTVQTEKSEQNLISWNAFHQGKLWLNMLLNFDTWEIQESNDEKSADFLRNLLKGISECNASAFEAGNFYSFTTNLQFPSNFGLGSSSTLINNLAEWSGTDAFELNHEFLKGSGYDIAVAKEKKTILFSNQPEIFVKPVVFEPAYKDDIVFVHLNKKQDSRKGIELYRSKEKNPALIQEFSDLTERFLEAGDLNSFEKLIREHEGKMSKFLGIQTVQNELFSDYQGVVKSLGAWGGDFVLATKTEGWEHYFRSRNFTDIFNWDDLIS